jgi:hypothetical protein
MTEGFLVHIWKYGLFDRNSMVADTGETVEVISLGEMNQNAGPDFLNAKIRIGNTLWAGNVEIHLNASDWKKHKHNEDKSYDNVILHVVFNADEPVIRSDSSRIPSVVLQFDPVLYSNYIALINNKAWVPCQSHVLKIDSFLIHTWLASILVERLQAKTDRIDQLLEQYNNSWEEVFYIQLARNFGFSINAEPFEQLARSLPLHCLAKHKNNLIQTEALLFGQAGFLVKDMADSYYLKLKAEYRHLSNKFDLKPVDLHQWKFLRLRPMNFPTIRIAQFASLIHASSGLFRKIIETENLNSLQKIFSVTASDYWQTHYQFGIAAVRKVKALGKEAVNIILINTVIPLIFLYGCKTGNEKLKTRAVELLTQLPAEKNAVTRCWKKSGIHVESAFDSQALLQLYNNYCIKRQCLHCMIGNKIITSKM